MRDWIALALVERLGPRTFLALLERFGSPADVLRAPLAALCDVPGLGPTVAQRITEAARSKAVDEQLRRADKAGAQILTLESPQYPRWLQTIYDPPPVLFVRGTLEPRDDYAIAFVGARRAGTYGKQVTRYLASNCASFGYTIVSGMAAGVDTEAHRAALDAGGRTIAVLASGVDVPYPKFNAPLLDRIIAQGAAISESPMGATPEKGAFPMRNRIVSGLALGTVVTVAAQRSGALITARHALEQGREVFAVPGDIFSPGSDGTHALIRDGATLVQDPFDIRAALEVQSAGLQPLGSDPEAQRALPDLSLEETAVFNVLSLSPLHIDDVMAQCELTAAKAAQVLLQLELRGLARQLQGKHFVRAGGA